MSLCRSETQPFVGQHLTFWASFPFVNADAKLVLCMDVVLFSSLAIPIDRFGIILSHANAILVTNTEVVLCSHISLAEKDAKGNNYVLDRLYNIGENGRGLNALCQDYLAWSGIEVAKDELYSFDCNAAMKDKPVVVDVGYHVNGTKVTAVIKSFHPAGYTGPVPEVGA